MQLNSLSPQQRTLLRAMIMQMLQQRMAEQRGGGASRGSSGGSIGDYIKKAESIYKDGKQLYNFGSNIYNSFSQPAYSEATQAAWNQAAGEASQQAWNAGADAATREAGGQLAADNATSGLGNVAGGLAGAYMAYKGGDQVLDANKIGGVKGRQAGGMGGLQAGLGAGLAVNALGLALGPIGWAALLGGGLLAGGLAGSRLGDKDRWKTEGNRLKKLEEMGIDVPKEFEGRMYQTRGLKKSELINPYLPKDFTGYTPQYGWVNNKFQDSRNEGDMRYEDLAPYATWAEKRSDWYKLSDNQRRAVTDAAQKAGAVREHHGTLDVDWSKVGDLDKIIGQAPAQAQQQQQPSRFVLKNGELIKRNTIPRVR